MSWICTRSQLYAANRLAWSPSLGRFVACYDVGHVLLWSDDGLTWSPATGGGSGMTWSCVAWSPVLGYFLALDRSYNAAAYSSDGKVWTAQTILADDYWVDLTWCPALNLWIAISRYQSLGGTYGRIATSPTGMTGTWTFRTVPTGCYFDSIAWSAELGMAVVTNYRATSPQILTSTDGITWISRSVPVIRGGYRGVAWSPSLGRFVVCNETASPNNRFLTSDNGVDWAEQTPETQRPHYAVGWSVDRNLFISPSLSASWPSDIHISPNGIDWELEDGCDSPGALNCSTICEAPAIHRIVSAGVVSSMASSTRPSITGTIIQTQVLSGYIHKHCPGVSGIAGYSGPVWLGMPPTAGIAGYSGPVTVKETVCFGIAGYSGPAPAISYAIRGTAEQTATLSGTVERVVLSTGSVDAVSSPATVVAVGEVTHRPTITVVDLWPGVGVWPFHQYDQSYRFLPDHPDGFIGPGD